MINICMCDEDPILLDKYSALLNIIAKREAIDITIHRFNSGEMLIKYFQSSLDDIDIIFSDISMKGLNGIETVKILRNSGCCAEIIILTSSQDYIFEAFAINPLYYLSKSDVTVPKFTDIFLKAVSFSTKKDSNRFYVSTENETTNIPLKEILYFKKDNETLYVQCQHTTFSTKTSMDTIGKNLQDKNFIFSHPHFLVNLTKVKKITNNYIYIINGDKLPIEPDKVHHFKMALSNCLANSFKFTN